MKKILSYLIKYIISLSQIICIYSIGITKKNNREIIADIYKTSFLYKYLTGYIEPIISHKLIEDILPSFECKVVHSEVKYGNVLLNELIFMNGLIHKYNIKTIFEIGTFNGRTTLNFAINIPVDGQVYTLDLPPLMKNKLKYEMDNVDKPLINGKITGELFLDNDFLKEGKIIQLFGDSAIFNFEPYFNNVDMVFIDGSHSYNYVKNDTENAFKMLKNKKGIIIWHDYSKDNPGSTRYLNELFLSERKLFSIKNTSMVYYNNISDYL